MMIEIDIAIKYGAMRSLLQGFTGDDDGVDDEALMNSFISKISNGFDEHKRCIEMLRDALVKVMQIIDEDTYPESCMDGDAMRLADIDDVAKHALHDFKVMLDASEER